MRGIDERPVQFFSYVDIERRVPPDHPLRTTRLLDLPPTLLEIWCYKEADDDF